MGYLEGFAVTFAKLFEERLTGEYKAKGEGEKRSKPERFHGRHVLNRYEDGMEKCIGCELCAGVCQRSASMFEAPITRPTTRCLQASDTATSMRSTISGASTATCA